MKLTDFTEEQLKTEMFIMKSTGDISKMANGKHMVIVRDNGMHVYPVTISELLDTTWQIYKPELKLEKGKWYKDRAGSVFECLTTDTSVHLTPCVLLCMYDKNIYRYSRKGKYYTHISEEHCTDIIEEVPAPKESE